MLPFIVAAALFVAPAIAEPWTNATCVAEPWSFNSRAQSPCLVAAHLCAVCTADNTCGVYSLRETHGGPYGLPAAVSNCVCSSVMWSLLSACALCQGELLGTWEEWVASCPFNMTTVGKYPVPIPPDVTVPSWAYYDYTTGEYSWLNLPNVFDGSIASKQLGPESSTISSPTNTPAPAPTTTRAPSPSSETVGSTETIGRTSAPKSAQSQSQPSSNASTIIGGVVGGVLGVGLFILIAFVLTRKRKPEDPVTAQINPATPMTGQATPYQFNDSNRPVSTPDYSPYDPSDPSTFPTGPVMPANGHHVEPTPYSYLPQGAPGQQPYPSTPQV